MTMGRVVDFKAPGFGFQLIAEPTGIFRLSTGINSAPTPLNTWLVVAVRVMPSNQTASFITDAGVYTVPYTATVTTDPSLIPNLTVGYTENDSNGRFAHIDLAEMQWYDSALSTDELQSRRSAMKSQYNL